MNRSATVQTAIEKKTSRSRDDSGPIVELNSFLAYRLSKLAHRVTKTLAVTYAEALQMTHSEWKVLSILAGTEGLNATEVSARSTLDRFAVSKTIRRLLDRGLIARTKVEGDGRAMVLMLTTTGRKAYRPIASQAMSQQERLLDVLTPAERKKLFELIDKLDARLESGAVDDI